MSWTDERIDKLTKMWESGATASQIADDLGGVTRNAVIGKAHRLGLKARPSPVKANDKPEPVAAQKPVRAEAMAVVEPRVSAPSPEIPGEAVPDVSVAPSPAKPTPVAAAPIIAAPIAATPVVTPPVAPVAKPAPEPVRAQPDPVDADAESDEQAEPVAEPPAPVIRVVSVGPGGFLRQGPGDQQAPIPPAPPRRLVPARPSPEIADKTSLLDLNDRICRWPVGHPGEADFHFCGEKVNPGFPYCVEHCGRAYQAQLPRGHRRPPPPMPFGGPRVR